jgi:hypothetical protein
LTSETPEPASCAFARFDRVLAGIEEAWFPASEGANGRAKGAFGVKKFAHGMVAIAMLAALFAVWSASPSCVYAESLAEEDDESLTVMEPTANTVPVAVSDSVETQRSVPLVVAAPGVLSNDTDADGDTLFAELVTGPSHGTVVLQLDGSYAYTPDTGYLGTDSFSYRAGDGSGYSDPVSVTITVAAPARVMAPVYRFYNIRNGSHFYTASSAERDYVMTHYAAVYAYEGVAYQVNTADATNDDPLYRFYNKANGSHFYTVSQAERDDVISYHAATYTYEGPAYNVSATPSTVSVHRFYNRLNGSHFYTASTAEYEHVLARYSATYTYEGVVFWVDELGGTDDLTPVPVDPPDGMTAVYRFCNTKKGSHFYTGSPAERDYVMAHWSATYAYEGVAYLVDPSDAENDDPLYRFYNRRNGTHFYTASAVERDYVIAHYGATYAYEGPTYNVSATPSDVPVYRFYDRITGSHFYTASEAERDYVSANYSANFTYEGVAYWVDQPGADTMFPWKNPYGYRWSTYILIDKSDFRLYWIQNGRLVKMYPIAHGAEYGWTPNATWRVGAKYITDPDSVYGPRKMRLYRLMPDGSFVWTAYGIHGTNEPWVIGTMASHGCIRLYNWDILELWPQVPLYTMVVTRD